MIRFVYVNSKDLSHHFEIKDYKAKEISQAQIEHWISECIYQLREELDRDFYLGTYPISIKCGNTKIEISLVKQVGNKHSILVEVFKITHSEILDIEL